MTLPRSCRAARISGSTLVVRQNLGQGSTRSGYCRVLRLRRWKRPVRVKENCRTETAYRRCLKAQLDLVTKASREPDLSALNGEELESILSACSESKRLHGTGGYNRCLTAQMAELAAEPARPDLSGLSEADRSSIEAACRNSKNREGPSAYNRCRLRLISFWRSPSSGCWTGLRALRAILGAPGLPPAQFRGSDQTGADQQERCRLRD